MKQAVCMASGPSLTEADVEKVRAWGGEDRSVFVCNTTFRIAPWADALYFQDAKWWRYHHKEVAETFRGKLYSGQQVPGVTKMAKPVMENFGNSGAALIALAMHFGCQRVILLGYDCSRGPNGEVHHHGNHPKGMSNAFSISAWPAKFARVAAAAAQRDVLVLNCSRRTILTCFPREDLDAIL